ncbi:hypothetical protein MAPG_07820 [Magnaporthiopsis poae ATCC 64411]|uniref:Uncharacterized protein n=1 Tax=Magnaporthiopsis poae (strain ATCC 64411 / 73-15) TaxID=644358 RepID=A0A0C4E5P6_MAGP6|nr:hypothetical protein MAPG_07820 [Magnaporthiopsis poae ATCC 64411]
MAKAARAQMRLSHGCGRSQGRRRDEPAETISESPAPNWMPLTTGTGMCRVSQRRRPVRDRTRTAAETRAPAATVLWRLEPSRMAAAAMAFMGWTGRGMPKTRPVATLKKPEKTRVADSEIDRCRARAIISGSRVPRSPRAPETSASGRRRIVRTLLRWSFGKSLSAIVCNARLRCGCWRDGDGPALG